MLSTFFGIAVGIGGHLWFARTQLAVVQEQLKGLDHLHEELTELQAKLEMVWKAELELAAIVQTIDVRLKHEEGDTGTPHRSRRGTLRPFDWPEP